MNPRGENGGRKQVIWLCVALAAITVAVFGQTLGFDFVSFDDHEYVVDNAIVKRGLTWDGVCWALTFGYIGHWHPVTWLTHMLDCQLYGLNPAGHHLGNLLCHTATVIGLFLVLRQMTAAVWRSAFVAAVFAVHPLRAESVCWIAERKDVLSGMFFVLTLWMYVRFVQKKRPKVSYVVALLLFALGLMSKNMLVTMPFVLLLLDWWPLRRGKPFQALLVEKVPFFLLSVGSCIATALVPEKVMESQRIGLWQRLGNVPITYVTYVWKFVWPSNLYIPYFYPKDFYPLWQVALAVLTLLAITTFAFRVRKRSPGAIVGWLWFLGMLVPTVGFVQISYYAARADRYTYLPEIGLAFAATWAVADLSVNWKHRRALLGALMVTVPGALAICGFIQTSYWKNSETLWNRTLACDPMNHIAHSNLGTILLDAGDLDGAMAHFQKVLAVTPRSAKTRHNVGLIYAQRGDLNHAISEYQQTLDIDPNMVIARVNLGVALMEEDRLDEAIAEFQKALASQTNFSGARNNLAIAYAKKGKLDQAIAQFQLVIRDDATNAEAHKNLALAYVDKGDDRAAAPEFQKTLELNPDNIQACDKLAWLLATAPDAALRNGARAVELARHAGELAGADNPTILRTLAAAQAEQGDFAGAESTARRALETSVKQNNKPLGAALQADLKHYQSRQPVRDVKSR